MRWGASRPPVDPYAGFAQVYVSTTGSDSNDGSEENPFLNINRGFAAALTNRQADIPTRINVQPGVYRVYTNRVSSITGPTIVVEATGPGVIVSGADEFTAWTESGGVYTHAWPYDWGVDPNPWEGSVTIGELARRREMVVVDGQNLDQVLTLGELVDGSFYVDEVGDTLHVRPPTGVTLTSAEVAVRNRIWLTSGFPNLVIKGITFKHAATEFTRAAVEFSEHQNLLLRDCRFEWNGNYGVTFAINGDVTIRDCVMDNNGSSGLGAYKSLDFLLEDTSTSFNNWRGIRGGYTGFDVGNKIVFAHRWTMRRHTANYNQSRGFWFDVDHEDILVEDCDFSHNLMNGVFLEKMQGGTQGIRVSRCAFTENGDYGIVTSALNHWYLEDCVFAGNPLAAIHVSGEFNFSYTNFETDVPDTINNSDWTWLRNTVTQTEGHLVRTTHNPTQFSETLTGANFGSNDYRHNVTLAFRLPNGVEADFDGWKTEVGTDTTSTFTLTGA
jgi:hypothetical protein